MTLLKRLLRGLGVSLLLVLVSLAAVVAYLVWPRHYPQHYRGPQTLEARGPTLAEEATRRGLWVGAARKRQSRRPVAASRA